MVEEPRAQRDLPSPREAAATAWLIERSIALLLVAGLLAGVALILKPFATAILFGGALAIAAWPLRRAMVRTGFGPTLAAVILLLASILVVALPLVGLAPNIAIRFSQAAAQFHDFFATAPPQPAWLLRIPGIGGHLASSWDSLVRAGGDIGTALAPYGTMLRHAAVAVAGALADSVLQVILSLVVATAIWVQGEDLALVLHDVFGRIGGGTAERALDVAAGAVRGVAYGVVGTAAIQAVMLALGLALAGVPGAAPLGFVGLLLAISQIGAPLLVLIWGGAAAWLFSADRHGWAVAMILWGVLISVVDNVLKPWLIGLGVGANIPMSLLVLGVFGGFLAFGFLGLFIGPALIAVAVTLLRAWREATRS